MPKIAPPPGVSDIFPDEATAWLQIESAARKVFGLYGFGELRTPIFEFTEVFQRGLGGDTLRPEGTAGVMRALAGTDAANGVEHRVFYMGPMFRGERPAAGRKRQFHQVGVENVGRPASPGLDAEAIAMLCHFLEEIGITGFNLLINTRGVASDRPAAEQALAEHFRPHLAEMCDDCRARIDRNVWRILDCKQACCRPFIESAPDPAQFFRRNRASRSRSIRVSCAASTTTSTRCSSSRTPDSARRTPSRAAAATSGRSPASAIRSPESGLPRVWSASSSCAMRSA